MYLSYRSYTCFIDTGVPVGTTELILILSIREYRRYYWTYTCFTDTGVPVGTTELILITDVYVFESLVEVTKLILIRNLYL